MKDKLTCQASSLIIGGIAAVYCRQEARAILLAFFITLLAGLYFIWQPKYFFGRISKPGILLFALGLTVGFFYGMSADKALAGPLEAKDVQLKGTLEDWELDSSGGRGILILDNQKKYSLRVYPENDGVLAEGWDRIRQKDRISFTGKLIQPKPPGTPGEFDYPLHNAVRGLAGTITTAGEVRLLTRGVPDLPWRIRHKVHTVLSAHWPEAAGVLEGILFGGSDDIPPEALEMYRAAGVAHIFAASGPMWFLL
jgi:competence protein ComEC